MMLPFNSEDDMEVKVRDPVNVSSNESQEEEHNNDDHDVHDSVPDVAGRWRLHGGLLYR